MVWAPLGFPRIKTIAAQPSMFFARERAEKVFCPLGSGGGAVGYLEPKTKVNPIRSKPRARYTKFLQFGPFGFP